MTRQDSHTGEADCLFFTMREAAALSASVDEVLVIDAIYTTNERGYALVQLIGTLPWGAPLPMGIGMLLSEDTSSYTSALCMSPGAYGDQEQRDCATLSSRSSSSLNALCSCVLTFPKQHSRGAFARLLHVVQSYSMEVMPLLRGFKSTARSFHHLFGHSAIFCLRAIDEKARTTRLSCSRRLSGHPDQVTEVPDCRRLDGHIGVCISIGTL